MDMSCDWRAATLNALKTGDSIMSNVSDRHTVVPFVSGETKALSGQRLAKVGYKDRGARKAAYPSIAVSVPHVVSASIAEHLQSLLPHIGTLVENTQDAIIRSLYESSDGTLSSVSDADISVRACINFLEAESNGSRLTADRIRSWFDAELRENLSVYVAEKLNIPNQADATVQQKCNVYRDTFAALSGKTVFMQPATLKSLESALALCIDDAADVARKISAKIAALSQTPVNELL
jgi:hypothetical protein